VDKVSDVLDVPDLQVRQRCQLLIGMLPIPRPFDLDRFRLALERWRGRPLRFVPAAVGHGEARGLWLATADADHIFYAADAGPLDRLNIIARELGHMLLAHPGGPASTNEMARLLLPALDPALVVRTLGPVAYSPADEAEADTFAALLLDHME
jgi:hypothetical protein